LTLSAILARSNSAIAPRMCIWSLPAGVVASIPSAREMHGVCSCIHEHEGAAGVRRILGVLSLAKKYGPAAADEAA
jgi:hypothetical protein